MKFFPPLTPSQRQLCLINRSHLWNGKPFKNLTVGISKTGGRNNQGRCTAFHRGGGHSRKYRHIDLKRRLHGVPALVLSIEYDPNRTSFIALLVYQNGICSYILAPHLLKPDDFVLSGSIFHLHTLYHIGFSGKLSDIPIGTMIHNIELSPSRGGQLVRAAGNYAMLMKKKMNGYCLVRLPSGEKRLVSSFSIATIGSISNMEHRDENLGKAGRNRWKGRRPKVRGVAMNPVDHPHGGATSGGRIPVTPWKKITKGQSTRKRPNKWISNEL